MDPDPYHFLGKIYDRFEPSLSRWRKIALSFSQLVPGMSVLDVGCGTGSLLKLYQAAGCQITGIDASPTMLAAARRKLDSPADLRLGNATSMPFADGSFDLVTATFALHEMPPATRAAVMREIIRVVKSSGKILVIEFKSGPYPYPTGWIANTSSTFVEWLAGREHYINFRQFIRQNGMAPLIEENHLTLVKSWWPEEGTTAIYLLRR
jgi:ubiquinone/menaquinone biosynthesis C-methylase UbiE